MASNNNSSKESLVESPKDMMRNIVLLSLCWAFGIGAAFVQVNATSLVTINFVGTSYSTIPVGFLFLTSFVSAFIVPNQEKKLGAKIVFAMGILVAIVGVIICILAIQLFGTGKISNWAGFGMMSAGSVLQGYLFAMTTRLRLQVSIFSTAEFMSKAVAMVIGGGVLGAILGPLLIAYTKDLTSVEYVGTYIQLVFLYVFYFLCAMLISFPRPSVDAEPAVDIESAKKISTQTQVEPRSLFGLLKTPEYAAVVFLNACIYFVMGMYMMATPIAMKHNNLVDESSMAIFVHQIGMFAPSLITGSIIKRLGDYETVILGYLIVLLGAGIFWIGNTTAVFIVAIGLIGIGWNFGFVAGSSRLVTLYSEEEKARAEAFSDGILLAVNGFGAVAGGFIIAAVSWQIFVLIFFILTIVGMVPAIYMAFKKRCTFHNENDCINLQQDCAKKENTQSNSMLNSV